MTIKEAQELVGTWNERNAVYNSELTSMALIAEKAGELASAIARKQTEPSKHHHDAPNPPLSEEASALFWELLSLCSHSGIDLTEALADNLNRRQDVR
ncbi:MAG: pyrophosphatase [Alistipes sp.]|nr:pyrophosphatase [Alistipes sp.]MCD8171971.1 pyrophosphatase [Alistipes sp.]